MRSQQYLYSYLHTNKNGTLVQTHEHHLHMQHQHMWINGSFSIFYYWLVFIQSISNVNFRSTNFVEKKQACINRHRSVIIMVQLIA